MSGKRTFMVNSGGNPAMCDGQYCEDECPYLFAGPGGFIRCAAFSVELRMRDNGRPIRDIWCYEAEETLK